MHYYLKSKNQFRPIAFLCGPYFKDQANDRRKILQDHFVKTYQLALPIIVDNFLDKTKINDDTIRIPLIEEICAAASFKIYIFLDTFSSVAELGMFSHAATRNNLVVFLPNDNDKLTQQLNFFIKEVLLSERIEVVYYHPKITRVPLASDYVIEYYEFPHDDLPKCIVQNIAVSEEYSANELNIRFEEANKLNENYEIVNYNLNTDRITFYLDLKLMFYIIASIIVTTNQFDPIDLLKQLEEILFNTQKNVSSVTSIEILTNIPHQNTLIISHIIKFLDLFEKYGQVTGQKILIKDTSFIRCATIVDYYQLSASEQSVIDAYNENNDAFVETFTIQKGTKTRKLVKYNIAQSGNALRNLHEKIVSIIEQNYQFSESSFAYRKHYSIRHCVSLHKESVCFIKIDISDFFNSITYTKLYNALKLFLKDDVVYDQNYASFIKSLMYKNILPLGYVSSPIISDVYLSAFDLHIITALNQRYPGVIYSRYADDLIFSSANDLDESTTDNIQQLVNDGLAQIQLRINPKKTTITRLENVGDHVKLLGLNIVKTRGENKLTVGRKYIYDTAKLLLEYLSNLYTMSQEYKYYKEKIISGRIAYINQIEGEEGYELLQLRLLSSSHGRLRIPNKRVDFSDTSLIETLRAIVFE